MPFLKFEDLRVFKAAENFADEIWSAVSGWDTFAKLTIGKQLVRSADSIGANIAEGSGRGAAKDNQRFVRMARGSLNETKYWLRRASYRNLIKPDEALELSRMIEAIGLSLNAYLKSLRPIEPVNKQPTFQPRSLTNAFLKHQTPTTKHYLFSKKNPGACAPGFFGKVGQVGVLKVSGQLRS
jgi:four helix bundle protein